MKQHMLTHKIRDMPPTFDKSSTGPPSEESTRDASPERRSSPDKLDLKRSPPAHPPPPLNHPSPLDMPPMPKRPAGEFKKRNVDLWTWLTFVFGDFSSIVFDVDIEVKSKVNYKRVIRINIHRNDMNIQSKRR